MDTRDTDIVQPLDMASHHFCGHTGFFRHGHVRSSRSDHEYMSMLLLPGGANRHNACIGIVLCSSIQTANGARDRRVGTSRQKRSLFLDECPSDGDDLRRGFPFTQDHLGEALS